MSTLRDTYERVGKVKILRERAIFGGEGKFEQEYKKRVGAFREAIRRENNISPDVEGFHLPEETQLGEESQRIFNELIEWANKWVDTQ